jgi:transcriptional regulator with XRE-family HTH domain
MTSTVNLSDLGRRVRNARLARRMTLEEVVSQTDFTISWLSKLENGQLAPSLEGLVRLAEVLHCGAETLVEGLSVPPKFSVVRKAAGRIEGGRGRNGLEVECLADDWRERAMQPTILHLSGQGNRKRPEHHDGERFLLVLEGEVKVLYGDELIVLAQGDSVYLSASIPHTLVPAGRGTAKVLSVAYEPALAGRNHLSRPPARPASAGSAAKTRDRANGRT